jgi:hypothetical protein
MCKYAVSDQDLTGKQSKYRSHLHICTFAHLPKAYLYPSTQINGAKKNYDPYPSKHEGQRGTGFHDHGL